MKFDGSTDPESSIRGGSETGRCPRYERAVASGTSPCRFDGNTALQLVHYDLFRECDRNLVKRVEDELCALGVAPALFLAYINFCRRVDRVVCRFEGRARVLLVSLAVADWTDKGCASAVLDRLSSDLFNVGVRED